MTRTEFEEKSFEDVMSQLNEELDEITTLDSLKEFIKEKLMKTTFVLQVIYVMQFGMILIRQ